MNAELVRIIDSIHRDKDISLDLLYEALEDALASALRKRYGVQEGVVVTVDRESGEIAVEGMEEPPDPASLGRICAQTAKQVMFQKIREAERDVILRDYEARLHEIVNGTVQRIEGGHVIINLGKTEAILPRREQIKEETYRVGDRVRCYIIDVKKAGSGVRIILSRSHPDLIKKLFELEVPEITERIIEIKAIAREPGYRTKIAVSSIDSKVDAQGACIGVRGTRIKNIVSELGGERIDIVRWSDQPDILIANALNPAEIEAISLNPRAKLARVIVAEDQLSRAIGALGQNVRLASKLTGWDIDVMSQQELDGELAKMKKALEEVPGVGDKTISKLFASGFSMKKLATTTIETIAKVEGVTEAAAQKIIECASNFAQNERAKSREKREARKAAPPEDADSESKLMPPIEPTTDESGEEKIETPAKSKVKKERKKAEKTPADTDVESKETPPAEPSCEDSGDSEEETKPGKKK